jgi:Zn-dependent M16 (insulinase) family peptidase
MNNGTISFNQAEFEDYYCSLGELLIAMSEAHALNQYIISDALNATTGGKPFYVSPSGDVLADYHSNLALNIKKLNSFYSKAFEYLEYTARTFDYTDEQLALIMQKRFVAGDD